MIVNYKVDDDLGKLLHDFLCYMEVSTQGMIAKEGKIDVCTAISGVFITKMACSGISIRNCY